MVLFLYALVVAMATGTVVALPFFVLTLFLLCPWVLNKSPSVRRDTN